MAMGWIGGVIGGNYCCYENMRLSDEEAKKNSRDSKGLSPEMMTLEMELSKFNTLEEKRNYLIQLLYAGVESVMPQNVIKSYLFNIEHELEEKRYKETVLDWTIL